MNKCFECGAEFEGALCPECGAPLQQDAQNDVAADSAWVAKPQGLIDKILNYAPIAFYSLWAVLLWAFYAASITASPFSYSMYGYYNLTSDSLMIGFYVLAGIACAFIACVVFAHFKGNKKLKLIANLGAAAIQLTVFIFALAVGDKLRGDGIETGSMVALVAAFAAIFAVLPFVTFLIQEGLNLKRMNLNYVEVHNKIHISVTWKDIVFGIVGVGIVIAFIIIFLFITHSI